MAENRLYARTVEVSGFPQNTADAELEAHFQDRKNGGGEIVTITRAGTKAQITFKDSSVADNVASQKQIFGSTRVQLSITRIVPNSSGFAQATGGIGMQRSPSGLGSSSSFSNDLNNINKASGGISTPDHSNLSDNRVRLKVTNIPPGITKKHIELLFKKNAGGIAPDVEYEADSTYAYLYYPSQEAAGKVLSTANALNKQPVDVCFDPMRPNGSSSSSVDSTAVADERITLIVSGIHASVTKKHIELYFKKMAGGVLPEVEYDIEHGTARLHFSDREVVEQVVKQDHALNKVPVQVKQAGPKPVVINVDANSDVGAGVCLEVTGIPLNTVKKHIELYFKKLAGGVQPEVDYDTGRGTALLVFPSQKDADLVLQQANLAINKVPVQVSHRASPRAAAVHPESNAAMARSTITDVEVTVVEPHQEELVRFYFMNYGFIDYFRYLGNDKKLLLRFSEPAATTTVLQKRTHEIVDQVKVTVVPAPADTMFGDDHSAPATCAASIFVTGIPPGICGKHLQLYFESTALSGGGDIASLEFASGSSSAKITFASSSVAQRVSTVGKHFISGTPLSVTLLQSNVDRTIEQLQDMDDSDFGPASVLVEGIPETLVTDHLRLYFSDRDLSGGGKIKKLHHNKRGGCAIVVFQDSEVAQQVVAAGSHKLFGKRLQVECLQSNLEPKEQVLLITGYLMSEQWKESLWWWLSSAAATRPLELYFKSDSSAAVALFDAAVAHKAIRFSCYNTLDGYQLTVKRLQPTKIMLITDLPTTLSATHLRFYLDHPNSGGSPGCVKDVSIYATTAKVEFGSSDVVSKILIHGGEYENTRLSMSPYYNELGQVSDKQKFALVDGFTAADHSYHPPLLILTGFSPHSDQSAVMQFFEDLKDADKGNAASVCIYEGELRAQLTDVNVAESIVKRAYHNELQFCGSPIEAKFREQRFADDKERTAVVVRNANHVSPDHLKYFVWALSRIPVVDVRETRRLGRSAWLVRFAKELEFNEQHRLPWLPANFQGSPFDVELVSKPCSIIVSNMPVDANEEYLKMLFSSNGAEMTKAYYDNVEASCGVIVEFASSRDVKRILGQHVFYDGIIELLMEPFY